jgi:Gpi18-like mannosyltransferase
MNPSKEFKQRILFALLFAFGLLIRVMLFPAKTMDMGAYIQWYSYIASHGIAQSLGSETFGYNPPFIYLLALATLTRSFLSPVIAIKLIPFIFDIINAILVFQIVRTQEPEGTKPLLAALIFWVAPTIFVNSGLWGQTDSFYTCFLLLTALFLIKEKPTLALVAFALSISVKAQGILFAPLLGVLFFKKRIPLYSFFVVPFVYALSFVPTILAGRPISSLFSTYEAQGETFSRASMNAANLYFFVGERGYQTTLYAGIAISVIIMLAWVFMYGFKKYEVNKTILIFSALTCLALVPFILPKMHDRYFYPADIFSIVMAFFLPELWLVPVAYQIISLTSYLPYLFNVPGEFVIPFAAGINTITVLFLLWKQWSLTNEK